MERIRAVIFDCDGVLFESRKANLAYYNRILEAFDYAPVTAAQNELAQLCHTASSPDVLAGLMAKDDVPPALAFAARLNYREFIPLMDPQPDLIEMLQGVSQCVPLAVATNRGTSIRPILGHFGLDQFFRVVVNSRDVARPKPEPDMLLLAARRLGLPPEKCLFVGDSGLDQRAAKSAGILFAGYGGGVEGDYALDNHRQLLQLFGGVSGRSAE